MEIKVLAFGQVAEITGKSEWKNSGINSTNELKANLIEQFPGLLNVKFVMAVNKVIIQQDTKFQNEDTVALLPPFSGG